jgi:hypothetical protein
MTQEDKELLLKDLSTRLPYGVKCKAYDCINYPYNGDGFIIAIGQNYIETTYSSEEGIFPVGRVLPYLRPMSSMTKEEKKELQEIAVALSYNKDDIIIGAQINSFRQLDSVLDFFNSHHFDYRGLIEKGLAIEITEKNNQYKE